MTSTDVPFPSFRVGSIEPANCIVMAPMMRSPASAGISGPTHAACHRDGPEAAST